MLVLLNGLQAGNRSGTGRYTYELARWLPVLDLDLDFAILWPKHVPRPHGEAPRHEAFIPRNVRGPAGRILFDQCGIRQERARLMANIVHYPANIGSLFGFHNVVLTVHDLTFLQNPRWFRADRAAYYRFAVGRSARLARRVIVDSQSTKSDLCERLRVPEDRVDVIALGVGESYRPASEEAQAAVRAKYRLPESYFLYVGTLEPRKNLPRLIQAWTQIAGDLPHDLVLAGRDGWKVGPIRREAAACPHAARIHFPGFIDEDDLPSVLSAAPTFVYPSLLQLRANTAYKPS